MAFTKASSPKKLYPDVHHLKDLTTAQMYTLQRIYRAKSVEVKGDFTAEPELKFSKGSMLCIDNQILMSAALIPLTGLINKHYLNIGKPSKDGLRKISINQQVFDKKSS
ncbi:hypothetical protein kac65v162_gp146 [Nodularia phage vB_NspS-kac65v162]|jgi:hypothetical protein|uniref:Uncharacterized protein n=3 Tax=Ravarandavirus kac65v151 TaxID=2845689 RepID=A0A482MHU1_9CAUD|nr:hypothetical protein HWC12_gp171 [Nodularia phage vB_NspS-kac65v151]QBQ73176.1 hypothetical protein kac65v151_gp146 [Nodularia phage vB_NspS-kac65v151]QBQ73384.1 hypothetical protein kac65v161_gp146 [Nodularia phage vB_NspS-kac65v161]QBQ73590.1 hypothetical protein kac65v162_gp146 [Nodularia phage vB_NspS-kac65v162]